MAKLWLITVFELKQNVLRKSFLLTLLSIPLMMGLIFGMGLYMESRQKNNAPAGYVDHSGMLAEPLPSPEGTIAMIAFSGETQAHQALDNGEIQAIFIISPDYPQTGDVQLVFNRQPGRTVVGEFYNFLRTNLLRSQPEEISQRATLGNMLIIRNLQDGREFNSEAPAFGYTVPLFLSIVFIGMVILSSGYLMDAVYKEKENRTVEVLNTSLSTSQLVGGKVMSVVAISLILLVSWIMLGILIVFLGRNIFGWTWLQNPQVDWAGVMKVTAIALPSYVTACALLFATGVLIATRQEGDQLGPFVFLAYLLPVYFMLPLGSNPNGPLAILLSLLPVTSLLSVGIRSALISIPAWQIAASFSIQVLTALGMLWLAARAYRQGMLRYGRRFRLSELLRRDTSTLPQSRGSHA
jgi:ABC-2 type transport system permease protein